MNSVQVKFSRAQHGFVYHVYMCVNCCVWFCDECVCSCSNVYMFLHFDRRCVTDNSGFCKDLCISAVYIGIVTLKAYQVCSGIAAVFLILTGCNKWRV